MNRIALKNKLSKYSSNYASENAFVPRFLDLLKIKSCYKRSLLSGHLTGSAWVLHPDFTKVLLLHHQKLDRWLQPGGHADGDEDILAVTKKELEEETGLKDVVMVGESFFDLDIHEIPARKEVPLHEHFDVRFAFVANQPDQLKKNEESNDLQWVLLDDLVNFIGQDSSMLRLLDKSKRLHEVR